MTKRKKTKKNGNLSPKKERFCQEWVIDCNSTKAAERTGYSKNSAAQQGSRLLRDVNIKGRIAELQAEIGEKLGVSQEKIVQEYAKLAFTNLTDIVEIGKDGIVIRTESEIDNDKIAALSEISEERFETKDGEGGVIMKRKVKMHDKKGALDSLARHLGMFNDKIQHTGANGGPIETSFVVEFVPSKEDK